MPGDSDGSADNWSYKHMLNVTGNGNLIHGSMQLNEMFLFLDTWLSIFFKLR